MLKPVLKKIFLKLHVFAFAVSGILIVSQIQTGPMWSIKLQWSLNLPLLFTLTADSCLHKCTTCSPFFFFLATFSSNSPILLRMFSSNEAQLGISVILIVLCFADCQRYSILSDFLLFSITKTTGWKRSWCVHMRIVDSIGLEMQPLSVQRLFSENDVYWEGLKG